MITIITNIITVLLFIFIATTPQKGIIVIAGASLLSTAYNHEQAVIINNK
jgi:hypothetical protein